MQHNSGWDNPADRFVIVIELLREMEEKMVRIKHDLKVAHDRKNSYAKKGITHR
jgi:hypothetical protein